MYDFQEYLRSASGQAMMLTFAGTAAALGLVAIWAATGRAHWFVRALAVWGSVMLLVPIRLYEPAAVFAVASPLTVVFIRGLNWLESRHQLFSTLLPLGRGECLGLAVIAALAMLGCEWLFPGHWGFELAALLAWCIILGAVVATIYDFYATRGRTTWRRLLLLFRLATISLPSRSTSLCDPSSASNAPELDLPTPSRMQFGLRDLFLLMLLVTLAIVGLQAIHQRYTAHEWLSFGIWGALVAAIVSLAYGCVVSRWRLVLAPLLALAVAGTARVSPGNVGPFFAERFIECLGLGRAFVWTGMQKLLAMEMLYSELALLIIVVCSLGQLGRASISQAPVRYLARGALKSLSACGGLSLAWLYWQMFWLTPIPPTFAGGTTHFDQIAAITRHADPRWFWGMPIPPVAGDTLRVLPVTGDLSELIAELSVLVQDENHVPFHVPHKLFRKEDVDDFRRTGGNFYAFAQVIDQEALRASTLGDYERAAELALINVRLGTMLQRGGTDGHAETGKYCESYGYQRLTKIRGHLAPETMRRMLSALSRAAALPEARAIVRARGQAFEERAIGWTERLRTIFRGLDASNRNWDPNTEINTFSILLQTDLAIRLFQYDRGTLPAGLDALTPSYLAALPMDPCATPPQPLRYRVENGQFVLYSVNSFGLDNGGTFGDRAHAIHHSTHDIDLETWIRP